jgi:anti-sigma regulatory factor (Ser/Thr protein kinase)
MLTSRQERQPFIQLILTLDRDELVILVRDFCPGTPQPANAGADDENGRGLFLVQSMSDRFGWHPADDGAPGKVVWAVVCPQGELRTRKEAETDDHPK